MRAELSSALAGRYEIERELGRGGMATVYLARDVKHGREVAVKVLDPDLASSLGAERFLLEIATAARLTHPNILPLHDSGEASGLLYYVMPYVRGETLRGRLDAERQLPIAEAITIARQVASALDYAHEQGVVHRDIKPENILIGGGGQAVVADFGLARALHTAASAPLTGSGMAVGTPAYMSPEQASAERKVDPRTDVYSLGCVVFEMIAGVPPYRGATVQAIIAHHIASPPPSVCAERDSCPEAVDLAIRRALAKTPADRFRTAGEFVRALDGTMPSLTPVTSTPVRARPRRRTATAIGVTAAVVGISAAALFAVNGGRGPELDQSKVVVLPFGSANPGESADAGPLFRRRLAQALGEWRGLEVVDEQLVREAVGESNDVGGTGGAMRIARDLRAGMLIRGTVDRLGDSLVVTTTSYDVSTGAASRSRELTFAAASAPTRDQLRVIANAMLRGREELPWTATSADGRPHLAAWRAYDAGRAALDSWDLATARERLRESVRLDPGHARAQLWLAQALTWESDPRASGDRRHAARQAVELRTDLAPPDDEMAAGLLALAESRYPDACASFGRVTQAYPRHFAAWYGIGDCQSRDSMVTVHSQAPSGYAFRGSYHSAASAYGRALDALPASRPDFAYRRVSELLFTERNRRRMGHRQNGDTVRYMASPALLGDTLAFIPYPVETFTSAIADPAPRSHARALERNTRVLRDLFGQWVRVAPENPLAHEKLAGLLETIGDIASSGPGHTSALSATRTARALTGDRLRRLALGSSEVRLLVKNEDFALAAALADSLLQSHADPTSAEAEVLLGLAALTGRLSRVAELLGMLSLTTRAPTWENGQPLPVPPRLAQSLAGARASAVLGVCSDSVRTLRTWADRSLDSHFADSLERVRVRDALVWRPLSQAVPCFGPASATGVRANDRLLRLQQSLATGGPTALRAGFDSLQVARRDLRPGDVSIDYTYHEAWLLAEAGDTARAVGHLDRTLSALSTLGMFLVSEPSEAAGLVRAMALRARLAAAGRDEAAMKRWAEGVVALWGGADSALQSDVAELRGLAGRR